MGLQLPQNDRRLERLHLCTPSPSPSVNLMRNDPGDKLEAYRYDL